MQTIKTTTSVLRLTLIALVFALIALVLLILPAEFGIDPTGFGQTSGVIKLYENTTSNPTNPESIAASSTTATVQPKVEQPTAEQPSLLVSHKETVLVNVPAGKGVEYKLKVGKFEKITYQWNADKPLYFDLHGEPKGDTSGYFESYAIATADTMKGQFVTPFAGSHGWYWKNKTDELVQVQLTFEGNFATHGLR